MSDERKLLWSDDKINWQVDLSAASAAEAYRTKTMVRRVRDDYEARIAELERRLEGAQLDSDGWQTTAKTWQPDWSSAPEWAQWWSVDADGEATFWQNKPDVLYIRGMWYDDGECLVACDFDLPIGIDWRTTLRQRPTEDSHE